MVILIFTNKIEFYPRHQSKEEVKQKFKLGKLNEQKKKENKNNETEEAILIGITVITLSN